MDPELDNFNIDTFIELKKDRVREFANLSHIDFSNSLIFYFENGVFDTLIHLESINLSFNMIQTIEDNLFVKNIRLNKIDLKNNNLRVINRDAFTSLESLQVLDLSENQIEEIECFCLNSITLNNLQLGHNKIRRVSFSSFYATPNLLRLELHHNYIAMLPDQIFFRLTKLQHLTLNDNYLTEVSPYILLTLEELITLKLHNNHIRSIDYFTFAYNKHLLTLDILDNKVSNIINHTFIGTPILEVLKLTVFDEFDFTAVKDLDRLTVFHLIYQGDQVLSFRKKYIGDYFGKKENLATLILVFKRVDIAYRSSFSELSRLEVLQIECLEPNEEYCSVHFAKQLNRLEMLKKLTLKNLNYFMVMGCSKKTCFTTKNLIHLDLTGMKNVQIDDIFDNFLLLEYLNLSNSKLMTISPNAFRKLVKLNYLYLDNSGLKHISAILFAFNSQLKVLNCANCFIETIENYSFRKLRNLEVLDLRNNCIRNLGNRTFHGLGQQTKIYLDGNIC